MILHPEVTVKNVVAALKRSKIYSVRPKYIEMYSHAMGLLIKTVGPARMDEQVTLAGMCRVVSDFHMAILDEVDAEVTKNLKAVRADGAFDFAWMLTVEAMDAMADDTQLELRVMGMTEDDMLHEFLDIEGFDFFPMLSRGELTLGYLLVTAPEVFLM